MKHLVKSADKKMSSLGLCSSEDANSESSSSSSSDDSSLALSSGDEGKKSKHKKKKHHKSKKSSKCFKICLIRLHSWYSTCLITGKSSETNSRKYNTMHR